jgi:glycosyltransferase involved in cell wall biosynthesis
MLSVIIPANNEEFYIARCLDALLASQDDGRVQGASPSNRPGREYDRSIEVIVVANACTDRTVDAARSFIARADARNWKMTVLDLKEGGKLNALNVGDQHASGDTRIYLDADVVVGPSLLQEIGDALDYDIPAYASGRLVVSKAKSWVTRAYARFWCRLPFVTDGVPGCGIFAVNAAGRARWQKFPDIISDDTFVRLQFAPEERIGVPAPYEWPMVEGFRNLVRVRKRQDIGVEQIRERFPELMSNEGKAPLRLPALIKLAFVEFIGFCVYAAVTVAVRLSRLTGGGDWTRGR